jgi:GR25 family glycosyltransferase involved in LPS biosynthesis
MIRGYFINLARNEERRLVMEREISRYPQLNIERFDAINGKDISFQFSTLTPGALGCLLSHFEIIRKSINETLDTLIIEDDIILMPNISQVEEIIQSLNASRCNWDILYLDGTIVQMDVAENLHSKMVSNPKKQFVAEVDQDWTIFGTHAYVINRASKIKVLEFIGQKLWQGRPIDNIYVAGNCLGALKSYLCLPYMTAPSELSLNSEVTQNANSDQRIYIWDSIRRHLANVAQEEPLSKFTSRHRLLFGGTKFSHFIK